MKAPLIITFLLFVVLVHAQDPCPSGQSCTYTDTGGDCSAGDVCTFTLTSYHSGSIIRCGTGACNVDCSGYESCSSGFFYGGSGPVTVTCSDVASCEFATMIAGSGSFNVQCTGESGCMQSTINGGSGPLTIGFLGDDSGNRPVINGGSGPLDVTCAGDTACYVSTFNAGTDSTTVNCVGRFSCYYNTFNIGGGWFDIDCQGNPANYYCDGNTFNQQDGALFAPDVPASYFCTDNQWQCSPDSGNPNCVTDHCDCPQFSDSPSCKFCLADPTTGNATWDVTLAPATGVTGTCNVGFAGAPTRDCQPDGSWSTELGGSPCVPACPAQTGYGHASWPATPLGQVGNGVCDSGYTGTTQRKCNADGSWASRMTTLCQRIYCPADPSSGNANWPVTSSSTWRVGTCLGGIVGNPHRFCGADGNWGPITQPCTTGSNPCPSVAYNNVLWNPTQPGTFGSGTCLKGSGTPSRYCDYNGNWAANLQTYCV